MAGSLAAQSTRLNGPLAPGRGAIEAFRVAPDGSTVVYSAQQDSADFDLYRVDFAGGPSTRVNVPSAGSFLDPFRFEITPDSRHVVFTTTSGSSRDLFAAPLAGGPAVELDEGPADGRMVDGSLVLAPDGRRALYVTAYPTGQRFLVSVPITGGAPVSLAGPVTGFGGRLMTPDSSGVVFSSDLEVAGRFEVYRSPLDGSTSPVRLSPGPTRNGDASFVALSPDGQWVVFASTLDTTRPVLYSVPLAGGPAVVLDPPSNSSVAPSPTITADSARVLFEDGVNLLLYSAPIDGSAPAVTLAPTLRVDTFQSAPDGGRIVFSENLSSSGARLFSVPAAGGDVVQLSAPGFIAGARFQLTPDGTHVLYQARPGSGLPSSLYRVPILGGASVELHQGLRDWLLAPDGGRVGLVDEDSFETLSVPVDGSPAAPLFPGALSSRAFAFSPDSQSVLSLANYEVFEPRSLYRTAAAGQGRLVRLSGELAELPAVAGVSRFELLPSEKRVLYQAREVAPGAEQLFSVESAGLERGRLDPDAGSGYATVISFLSTPDGSRSIFAQVRPEGFALYAATTDGGLARPLTPFLPTTPGSFGAVFPSVPYDAAPGSRAAAFVADLEQDGQRDLYRVRLRSGSPVRLNPPLVAGGNVQDFAYAPAGGRIVYRADQDSIGQIELYSVAAGVGPASAVELSAALDADSDVGGFRIDPTGARVVYRTEGTRGLFVARTDGLGAATEILRADGMPANLSGDFYQLSSDGSSVVFPAAARLFSAPLAGGPTVELGAELGALEVGSFGTALAPDSSRVAFSARLTLDDARLYTAPLAGGPATEIAVGGGQARFTNASDRVLYLGPNGIGASLLVAPAAGGASVLLSGGLLVRTFALRADDQLVGFSTGWNLYVARLDGLGPPQRVNEFDADVEDTFVLGAERIFYLAGPIEAEFVRELYSRPYANLPPGGALRR